MFSQFASKCANIAAENVRIAGLSCVGSLSSREKKEDEQKNIFCTYKMSITSY
jgi:hypothetical protein